MTVPFIITEQAVSIHFKDGSLKTMAQNSPQFRHVLEALRTKKSEEEIRGLFSLNEAAKKFSDGKIQIEGGVVYYNSQAIHNSVARRILDFMSKGLPWQPLARFLENLMSNFSKRSVDTLYNFLEHKNLAITDDGCFLAYKAIRGDYTDKHSGKFSNLPGGVLSMPRNEVCDDPTVGCSYGFHVGSLEYVRDFASNYGEEGGDKIVVVKVNPADVVAVPHDCQFQKVRTARYEVVREYTGPLPEYEQSCGDHSECCDDAEDDDTYEGIHVTVRPGQKVVVHACSDDNDDDDCDCKDSDRYVVKVFYRSTIKAGEMSDEQRFEDRDEAVEYALECAGNGYAVEIVDTEA